MHRVKKVNKTGRSSIRGTKLGRYPFAVAADIYMRARAPVLSASTADEIDRKLKLFCKIFEDLKRAGTIRS